MIEYQPVFTSLGLRKEILPNDAMAKLALSGATSWALDLAIEACIEGWRTVMSYDLKAGQSEKYNYDGMK